MEAERGDIYRAALRTLVDGGHLFPCRVSRRDLRELASAPHGPGESVPYPPSLRPDNLATGWFDEHGPRSDAALRFRVPAGEVAFEDAVVGPVVEDVRRSVGDFVLERRDGVFAYQLAVVVDDLAMGVTEVVRGMDLLDSTARQVLLIRALGGEPPAYAHLPLLVEADGEKLSKRAESLTIRSLREAGVAPQAVVGWLAATLGQDDAGRRTPAEVAATFDLARVRPAPVRVPDDAVARLLVL